MYSRGLVWSSKAETLCTSMMYTLNVFHRLSGRIEYTLAARHKAHQLICDSASCRLSQLGQHAACNAVSIHMPWKRATSAKSSAPQVSSASALKVQVSLHHSLACTA